MNICLRCSAALSCGVYSDAEGIALHPAPCSLLAPKVSIRPVSFSEKPDNKR